MSAPASCNAPAPVILASASPRRRELLGQLGVAFEVVVAQIVEHEDPATDPRVMVAHNAALKADWKFYLAYNLFRIAAILQGIAKRVEAGTASSAQAIKSGEGARPMAELAWKFAQKA